VKIKFSSLRDRNPEITDRPAGTRLNLGRFSKLTPTDERTPYYHYQFVLEIDDNRKTALNFNSGAGFIIWDNGLPRERLDEICTALQTLAANENINIIIYKGGIGVNQRPLESWTFVGDLKTLFLRANTLDMLIPAPTYEREILEKLDEMGKSTRVKK